MIWRFEHIANGISLYGMGVPRRGIMCFPSLEASSNSRCRRQAGNARQCAKEQAEQKPWLMHV
jgi:hypothetical protein